MKEASGELSMTAVAVVAIAAVGVLFTTLIWPSIKANIQRTTQCSQAYGCTNCEDTSGGKKCTCYYLNEKNEEKPVTCTLDEKTDTSTAGMIIFSR